MKRLVSTLIVGIFTAAPAFADPVLGLYQTEPGDTGSYAHVELYQCGAEICGVIRQAFDASGSPVDSDTIGKRMIWEMAAKGEGSYSGGKIWAPDRDKVYKSKMQLSGSSLKVSGCVAVICRSQSWKRVN